MGRSWLLLGHTVPPLPRALHICCALLLSLLLPAAAPAAAAFPHVFVKGNASEAAPYGARSGGGCQVLFLDSQEDALLPSGKQIDLGRFDAVLTDAHDLVPWTSSSPPLHYIDPSEYPHQPGRELFERKRGKRSVSLLVPKRAPSSEVELWTQEALATMPADVYVDDGTAASRRPAFEGYAFSVLLSLGDRLPPKPLLECIAYAAVPMLVWTVPHFINYTVHFPYAVGKFRPETFSPQFAQAFIEAAHEDAVYVFQNSLMMVQDFFFFRYSLPFYWRLQLHAARLCEDAAMPPALRTDIFIAIYSAKAHYAKRRAARETWLGLLAAPVAATQASGAPAPDLVTTHKFFMNAVGAGDPDDEASSPLDNLLRAEADAFGDMVFLAAAEEYPIGNMGRLALHWIANHTTAPFVLKLDDDMYIRPLPLVRHLARQQHSMLYWGFFERSGLVVRDPASAHFLPADLFGHDGVFPPYARGAALALSLDLVRLIVHFDRRGSLRRLKIEDASYGYFLWQLIETGVTSVTLADRDEPHFALDPKCCTEQTHPNNCWSPLGPSVWIVHHVSPRTVRCMFRTDVEAGYYVAERTSREPDRRQCLAAGALSEIMPGDDAASGSADDAPSPCHQLVRVGPLAATATYDPKRHAPLPSLCGCVDTPAPHPGQPRPGPLAEGPQGPRLHSGGGLL